MDISPEDLIAMADQALYHAKRRGCNSVCLWGPELVALPERISAMNTAPA